MSKSRSPDVPTAMQVPLTLSPIDVLLAMTERPRGREALLTADVAPRDVVRLSRAAQVLVEATRAEFAATALSRPFPGAPSSPFPLQPLLPRGPVSAEGRAALPVQLPAPERSSSSPASPPSEGGRHVLPGPPRAQLSSGAPVPVTRPDPTAAAPSPVPLTRSTPASSFLPSVAKPEALAPSAVPLVAREVQVPVAAPAQPGSPLQPRVEPPSPRVVLASLGEALARVEREAEPVVKTLGFRALAAEASPHIDAPATLERDDERAWAEEVFDGIRTGGPRTRELLDEPGLRDLSTLVRLDEHRAERAVQQGQHLVAAERARATEAQRTRTASALAALEEQFESFALPRARIAAGFSVSVGAFLFAAVLLATGAAAPGFAAGALTVALGGLVVAAEPWQRRAWLLARLRSARSLLQSHEAETREAQRALAEALKRFEDVDAECQREEAAAQAALSRRRGAERYLRVGGPSVSRR